MNVLTPANRGYTLASMGLYLDLVTALEPTSVPGRDAVRGDVRRRPRREHSSKLVALSGAPGTGDETRRGRGMVVATQQVAADAGRELLVAGGSAADAVVATAFASCVVDPSNCGVGGYGGFLVYAPAGDE